MEILIDGKLVVISKESDVNVMEQNPLTSKEPMYSTIFEIGTYENGVFVPKRLKP